MSVEMALALASAEAALAVEKQRANAAEADAKVQNKACAEEMLKRQHMQVNWDAMVASVKQHYESQLNAESRAQSLSATLDEAGRQLNAAVAERNAAISTIRRLVKAFTHARPYFEVLLAQADNEDTDVKGIVQELFAAVEDAS